MSWTCRCRHPTDRATAQSSQKKLPLRGRDAQRFIVASVADRCSGVRSSSIAAQTIRELYWIGFATLATEVGTPSKRRLIRSRQAAPVRDPISSTTSIAVLRRRLLRQQRKRGLTMGYPVVSEAEGCDRRPRVQKEEYVRVCLR